jgi:imidazoleglycerol-phosphate dehydratase/histidinol-phosphatase
MIASKKKVLFIDRDGTLALEPADEQLDAVEKLIFYPGALQYLPKIAKELDYKLVMVTNQDGLGTESHPEANFWPVHELILRTFEGEGAKFEAVHIDNTFAHENAPTRKPGVAMLTEYFDGNRYDLANSFVIGDRVNDVKLAENLGAKAIWLYAKDSDQVPLGANEKLSFGEGIVALQTDSWQEVYTFLRLGQRRVEHYRNTNETKIKVTIDLDGRGHGDIHTGLGFFDHMLDQLARHGRMDLSIQVAGDLHVDEHHTIEDTGIALGEAFLKALGDKRGIERYAFVLPMDDCLAQVVIDFGGRNWLVWDADFHREKIGDMPTEMFFHFFKSFSDAAKCNLNIKAEGTNEHHKIESIFKAFAKAIRKAVQRDVSYLEIPSTKGTI